MMIAAPSNPREMRAAPVGKSTLGRNPLVRDRLRGILLGRSLLGRCIHNISDIGSLPKPASTVAWALGGLSALWHMKGIRL